MICPVCLAHTLRPPGDLGGRWSATCGGVDCARIWHSQSSANRRRIRELVLDLESHLMKSQASGQSALAAQIVIAIKRVGATLSIPDEEQLRRAYLDASATPTAATAAAKARPS